jgi:hypothetical protein
MYCGSTLVSDGLQNAMTMTEVRSACGNPIEHRRKSNELVYDDNKNIVVIRFDTNGKVQSVNRFGSAGQSAQDQKIEEIDKAIKETGTVPTKPAGARDTDTSTLTKGKEADSRSSTKGRDANPNTVTKGVDATPDTESTTDETNTTR